MTTRPEPAGAVAEHEAQAIYSAFRELIDEFREITARAASRFRRRDWHGLQSDAQERLDLYSHVLGSLETEIRLRLAGRLEDESLWRQMKIAYRARLDDETNFELAQTFFNSVTRRVFSTVGVNPEIEFVLTDSAVKGLRTGPEIYRRYTATGDLIALARRVLTDAGFDGTFEDLDRDARAVGEEVQRRIRAGELIGPIDAVEMLHSVFFRNKGAYVVGRARSGIHVTPFVLALMHGERGIFVDALLTQQTEVSIVFSFTRSYFLVVADCPREVIVFLKSIMPLKPIAELYIALGFNKHGKTELYRSLIAYMRKHDDRFEIAHGDRGMVMHVFMLAGFDVVFKIILDRFAPPKATSRRMVMERYRLVFKHDRVGRLIDAQEYEHLRFHRSRFSEELLDELLACAAQTVRLVGDDVTIAHVYAERRVTPLNLYLREAPPAAARAAVVDYGRAIKELAAANIFPGDFLLKNFGVTRHGRVVFYDYDELCLVDECRFRRLPPSRTPEDDLSPEPWFTVDENDVFPEEFRRFLGIPPDLRETFEEHHADLFTVDYWQGLQHRHRAGELIDVIPYPESRRLSSRWRR